MNAPAWVNVVLEGGGLTLERALVAYRQLARHLEGDWRPQAREVQTLALQILEHEAEVKDLEARAVRRSTLSQMVEVDRLAKAVASARAVLLDRLALGGASLQSRLTALEAEAADEAFLHRAWDRFRAERFVFSWCSVTLVAFLASSATSATMTTLKYLQMGGPLRAPEPLDWGVLLLAVPLIVVSWFRLASWEWLGMRIPKPIALPITSGRVRGVHRDGSVQDQLRHHRARRPGDQRLGAVGLAHVAAGLIGPGRHRGCVMGLLARGLSERALGHEPSLTRWRWLRLF